MEIFLPVYDIEWLLLSRSWFNSVSSVQLLSLSDSLPPHELQHASSLSITNSWSLPKPMSLESVMPSNHLSLYHLLILLLSIFPSIRVFSNESALRIMWPKYWSFSFSISPSNEYPGWISFRRCIFLYFSGLGVTSYPVTLVFLMDPQSHLFSFSTTFFFVVVRMAAVLSSSWIRAEAIISHLFSSLPSFFLPLPLSFLSSSLPSSNILALFTFSLLWQPQSISLFLWVCF